MMWSMRDARPWTYAALFGALWGALELSLGSVLYLARLPLHGAIMSLLGLVCLICLRRLQPTIGVCALAGMVAIVLKIFTLGGLYPGPLIGIGGEALLMELAFTLTGSRRLGAVVGGALVLAMTPIQLALGILLLAGREALHAFAAPLRALAMRLGAPSMSDQVVLLGVAGILGAVGALGALGSWWVAGRVLRRLGGRP